MLFRGQCACFLRDQPRDVGSYGDTALNSPLHSAWILSGDAAHVSARATSVCAKSSPLNSSGSPMARASA